MPAPSVLRDIVLVGGGHSHVGVLRAFAMQPLPGARITLVCTDPDTPYSGMLPGYVAGHYAYDEVHIDLRRLAAFAGARFLHDEAIGIDRANKRVLCKQNPPLPYDVLSINIGATPQLAGVPGADAHAVPIKPIRHFNERWLALLARVRTHEGPTTLAIVGAGAAGVEIVLAMQHRLRAELRQLGCDPNQLHMHLLCADAHILPTHNRAVRAAFLRTLVERGVTVHLNARVSAVSATGVHIDNGAFVTADEVLWVTQAGAAAWLGTTGLALDADGFIRVRPTLQSESDPAIFAAGDCASFSARPLEKAGVFAVRMGRPLAENLRRSLLGQALIDYRPQRRWLALISTGDRHAIASRGALYARGDWVWRWKDYLDRRFMRRFCELPTRWEATNAVSPALTLPSPTLALIVPTLNESAGITAALHALAGLRIAGHEIIVVDGGSDDDTAERARPLCDQLLVTARGRARQMNAGAAVATADVLLFLHADTRLPDTAAHDIASALANGAQWGRFDVRIAGRSRWLPVIAALMNIRSRLTGIATGDQAMFVRRDVFERLGGFADIPLMEDIELSQRLRKIGVPACLRTHVTTSGRRWDTHGALRTIVYMWWLRARYFFGTDPAVLARRYDNDRP